MQATNKLRKAGLKSANTLPAFPTADDPSVSFPAGPPPQVIVSQVLKNGPDGNNEGALIVEHILRDVHWSVKGIERREYTSEYITASPSGLHRVDRVASPRYLQGPGGIQQTFPETSAWEEEGR
jgi:hypothetical protein